MSRLTQIFEVKREELAASRARVSQEDLIAQCQDLPPTRGFRRALIGAKSRPALIAEVKQASPSMGLIRPNLDPIEVAQAYQRAGAHCLSVLTDVQFFQGSPENLIKARQAVPMPILRKDFTADPYHVYEARVLGADAILLILAELTDGQASEWQDLARSLGLDALVEVHTADEADRAVQIKANLIGINNRDLATFETDIAMTELLLPVVQAEGVVTVSESALHSRDDVDRVSAAGAQAVLIGTAFCSAPDIEAKVREVMPWSA